MNEWQNFGDVNPIEHGGFWIAKDGDCENSFYIMKWSPADYFEDGVAGVLQEAYIDLDMNIEWESVGSYADLKDDSPVEHKVMAVIDYYGAENFSGESNAISLDKLYETLKLVNVKFERI